MKETISGKNVIKEMKSIAKTYFANNGNPSCVCVGVARLGKLDASGRSRDAQERHVYVGVSGGTGRGLLRDTLNQDGSYANGAATGANIVADLTLMAETSLNKYRSKKSGTAITQAESWTTHNCAESALALYLFKHGHQFSQVTIASYEISGGSIRYKPLCNNCAQWVKQNFKVLPDFSAHT